MCPRPPSHRNLAARHDAHARKYTALSDAFLLIAAYLNLLYLPSGKKRTQNEKDKTKCCVFHRCCLRPRRAKGCKDAAQAFHGGHGREARDVGHEHSRVRTIPLQIRAKRAGGRLAAHRILSPKGEPFALHYVGIRGSRRSVKKLG